MRPMMYPVNRPWMHPGTASIPKGNGVGVPSLAHRSKSPSRQLPWSVLIQSEADIETIMRKKQIDMDLPMLTTCSIEFSSDRSSGKNDTSE